MNTTTSGRRDLHLLRLFTRQPIPHAADFLRQVAVVDNAACSWLALVKGINLNIWQGFDTEDDLVNYALNKAYFNNVTVVAGGWAVR